MEPYSEDDARNLAIHWIPWNFEVHPTIRPVAFRIVFCLLWALLGPLAATGAPAEEVKSIVEAVTCPNDYSQCFKELLPIQDMRVTAYTKAFVERFGLEPPAPGTEPDNGLEAMELRVQRTREWTNLYRFTLSLYIDSRLPIILPEAGTAGNLGMVLDATHFFGGRQQHSQRMKWPQKDREFSNKLNGSYNMKAFLATMNYIPDKKGAIDSIGYEEFHK